MPDFTHGKIWLECQGQPMKEYGETVEERTDEATGQQIIKKTCFVEIVPDATFEAHWSYRRTDEIPNGVAFASHVNGDRADSYGKTSKGKRTSDFTCCSEGFRNSASTVSPYTFKPCTLTEDETDTTEPQFGTFAAIVKPLFVRSVTQRTYRPHEMAASKLDYHIDSKAAVVGFSVGYGHETLGKKPLTSNSYNYEPEKRRPVMEAVFLYRTRVELIIRGFVEEEKDQLATGAAGGSNTSVVVSQSGETDSKLQITPSTGDAAANTTALKQEAVAEAEATRKRAREPEAEAGPSGTSSECNVAAKKEKV